ncbi:hypothetical protein CDAR_261391 [Caerostris darwini]|uniref:Uncharacterized protein n=1 Tax=Caerostris darwini TaxID=1538125 RepID=A0AAV4STC5_9ARAC|nr:hypothetical protein CDAR_261391 [Caerostris darwini]
MTEQIVPQIPRFSHRQRTLVHRCVVLVKDNFFLPQSRPILANFGIHVVKKLSIRDHSFCAMSFYVNRDSLPPDLYANPNTKINADIKKETLQVPLGVPTTSFSASIGDEDSSTNLPQFFKFKE